MNFWKNNLIVLLAGGGKTGFFVILNGVKDFKIIKIIDYSLRS